MMPRFGTRKVRFFIATSLSSLLIASGAQAQDTPQGAASPEGGIQDIVVTAQKRSQNLRDVPLSITALTSDALNQQNVNDISAIAMAEPGLQIANNAQKIEVTIRGIGASSVVGAFEQPVAVHVDGFYQARSSGVASNFYDVERVEVLKGPQGTLYGRNATGGAINIIYSRPEKEFSASVRGELIYIDDSGIGTGWGYAAGAILNVPINDKIQTRFSAIKVNRDGYTTIVDQNNNRYDGQDADNISLRGAINIDLTDRLNWYVTGDYYHSNDRSGYIQVFGPSRADVPLTGTLPVFGGRNCGKCRVTYSDFPTATRLTNWGVTSTLSYEANDNVTLKSMTQYRRSKFYESTDFDGTDIRLGYIIVPQLSKQFSQEIQVAGDYDRLKFVLGGYYFRETVDIDTFAGFPIAGTSTNGVDDAYVVLGGRIKTKALSAFADATFDVTDKFAIVAGARYNHEVKGGANNVINNLPAFGPDFIGSFSGPVPNISFNAFTPKIGVNYKPSNDVLLYASYTKGFKSGGYNIGNQPARTDGILADGFNPEKVDAYEAGLKATSSDRRIQANLAAFFYKYSDLQLNVIIANSTVIQNSGKAEIYGLEGSVLIQPVDDWNVNFSMTAMSPKFVKSDDRLVNPLYPELGPQDIAGKYLPRAPESSIVVGTDYTFRFAAGHKLTPSVSASYKSRQYFTTFNDQGIEQGDYWVLKSSLSFRTANDRLALTLYGDNLTNKLYYTGLFPGSLAFGYQLQGITSPGRTIGLRADIRF